MSSNMQNIEKYWSDSVHQLDPYVPGEQPKTVDLIKLNTNENPYPPSPEVLDALTHDAIGLLRLYPDPNSEQLKQAVAEYYGMTAAHVFVGNGSDEVLAHIFKAFFEQAKPVLFPDITYSFYPVYCNLFGIDSAELPLTNDFTIDLEDYDQPNGGIIFPNPNAPTGIGLGLAAIERLLQKNTESVVVVDEAYIDFGGQSAADLVRQYPNLVVVQTLSKSRSLAGVRIGFAIGDPDLITALNRVKNSFNSYPIDRIGEKAAIAAIKDKDYFESSVEKIIATREWTSQQLQALGFTVLPSQANFIFTRPPSITSKDLFERLREQKIIVRYFAKPRISEYLRITIGTDDEMRALVTAIKQLL